MAGKGKSKLKLQVSANPGYLAKEAIRQAVYGLFVDVLLDLAQELQEKSYVGASKAIVQPSLKGSWDVIAPRKESLTFNINASVVNTAPASVNRIAGREPGKFPPLEPIQDWVKVKLGITEEKRARAIAFLIGRKIANEGTERYRTKQNFAGINHLGRVSSDSIILKYERILIELLEDL